MSKINVLKVLGIPNDDKVKVVLQDGFFVDFNLFFDGNTSFLEQANFEKLEYQSLFLGGENQKVNFNLKAKPDIVVNTMCDPVQQTKSLFLLENIPFDMPILNKPKDILKTARDQLPLNLNSTNDFIIPKTYKIKPTSSKQILEFANEYFEGESFLFRPVISHGGKSLIKVDKYSVEEFEPFAIDGGNEFFITEFVDYKSSDGLYKKARFFILDGKVLPRHLIISKDWKIHSNTREELMDDEEFAKQEENFLANVPNKFIEFCKYVYEYVGLDFFGIDCAVTKDGKIVLFEANVCMRPFANHKAKYLQEINANIHKEFEKLIIKKSGKNVK